MTGLFRQSTFGRLGGYEVRLQLHALACNFANFMRTLALTKAVEHGSLTSLREKMIKIGTEFGSYPGSFG
jgi:hypothetical protein